MADGTEQGIATRDVPLADKLAFLGRPDAYPEPTGRVETRETHMSWVFLTDAHAYKLKKPVRYPFLDYSTLAARERMCRAELRLNRRLADWVYLDVVPLTCAADGSLGFGEDGEVIEWLVKMVRLEDALMLDRAIPAGAHKPGDAGPVARHLARFFREAGAVPVTGESYVGRFRAAIQENVREIDSRNVPQPGLSPVVEALDRFLDRHASALVKRAEAGCIVEGHGDLRPEHIYLGEPPAVIDCLEFNRTYRLLDPLEELASLAMECRLLDGAAWGQVFLDAYLATVDDDAPAPLIAFYAASRALLRARLALGHLTDGDIEHPDNWIDKAGRYLDLAGRYL